MATYNLKAEFNFSKHTPNFGYRNPIRINDCESAPPPGLHGQPRNGYRMISSRLRCCNRIFRGKMLLSRERSSETVLHAQKESIGSRNPWLTVNTHRFCSTRTRSDRLDWGIGYTSSSLFIGFSPFSRLLSHTPHLGTPLATCCDLRPLPKNVVSREL